MRLRPFGRAGLISLASLGLLGCGGSDDDEPVRLSDAEACTAMQNAALGDHTTVTKATYVTADLAFGSATAVAPFCRIEAVSRPSSDSDIRYEVWMPPIDKWNAKFQGVGSGSSAGSIATTAMIGPLASGYAVMAQNNGHVTDTTQPNGAAEQTWALGHPEKIIDFAYRAQHVTTVRAKEMGRRSITRLPRSRTSSAARRVAITPSWRRHATRATTTASSPVHRRGSGST